MNILSKFDKLDITETYFDKEDLKYCKSEHNKYLEGIKIYDEIIDFYKTKNYNYKYATWVGISSEKYLQSINVDKLELNSKYKSKISEYFINKYSIKLDDIYYNDKYRIKHYSEILDYIKSQGYTLQELSINNCIKQIKKRLWSQTKINVKGKNITLKDFIYFSEFSNGYDIESEQQEKIQALISIFCDFHNINIILIQDINKVIPNLIGAKWGIKDVFINSTDQKGKYETTLNKLKYIQFFKNGNLKLIFNSKENCEQFYNKYLERI